MKIKAEDFLFIVGHEPRMSDRVQRFLADSEFADEYRSAYGRLLTCRRYRVIRQSIIEHVYGEKIRQQLVQLLPQTKGEATWYLYKTLAIGVARCAPDLMLTCIVMNDEVVTFGGVFTDIEKMETGQDGVHYDLIEILEPAPDIRAFAIVFGTTLPAFMEFAEVETLTLNSAMPGQRKGALAGERYITDIPADIEIVDSSWYRTLMHDAEFGVTGHFRLQPHGPMSMYRKLVYIKDFVKHGYHRQAKKERTDVKL
jgi:hypothetical protein